MKYIWPRQLCYIQKHEKNYKLKAKTNSQNLIKNTNYHYSPIIIILITIIIVIIINIFIIIIIIILSGVIHNDHQTQDSQQSESFKWWIHTRPHIKDEYKPLECMQGTGEILYIPSGWWWSNLNIDDSITLQVSSTSVQKPIFSQNATTTSKVP